MVVESDGDVTRCRVRGICLFLQENEMDRADVAVLVNDVGAVL